MTCGTPRHPHGAGHRPAYTPPHLERQTLVGPEALRGSKKSVTVLFCDLVDSTAIAREIGPEPMHEFLSQFFACALAEVHRYDGTVNQFLGDGFMAIFGAPVAFEDHAARAGLAALAIRTSLANKRQSATPGWSRAKVRMGLNSGHVVVGAIGDDLRLDYTAAGDTTHLAARLQAAAEADEILCGAAVVEAAGGTMEVSALAPLQLKGLSQPVPCYRLDSVNPRTTRAVEQQLPFVGRDAELASLAASWRAVCGGQGKIAEVVGEPGVGKSRLTLEFQRRIGADAKVIQAQCIPYGHQRPNVPIVELVQGLVAAGAPRAEAPANSSEPRYLAALCGDEDGLASLGTMDPATVRGRTQQALARLLEAVSLESPLLLIVEDLHWADPSSLDFLLSLAMTAVQCKVLLLVTFRPGTRISWPEDVRAGSKHLAPLSEADVGTLMAALPAVERLDPASRAALQQRAEGNPFFLEQLLRSALADGNQVPGNVYDVLGARIDALPVYEKHLLRAASVIGRRFSTALLSALVRAEQPVAAGLSTLTNFGFIEPTATDGRYRFVHALAQEVAYDGMLSGSRKEFHSAAAVHLAEGDPERDCEEIARHFLAGKLPVQALPFLEAATAKAIRQHTLEAAYGYLQDTLRLFDAHEMTPAHLVRYVACLLQAFPVFHFLHRHREYSNLLERFAPAVDNLPLSEANLIGAFLAQRGHRLWVEGRFAEAERTLLRAIDLCERGSDTVNAAHAEFMLAWLYAYTARYTLGEQYGRRSLEHLRVTPVPLFVTYANIGLMLSAVFQGDWVAARTYGEQARDVGLAADDDGLASFGGAFLTWLHYEMGEDALAIDEGRRAVERAPTQYFKGWAATFMAAAMARAGAADEAIGILDQSVGYAEQAGHLSGYALIALLRAEARVQAGQYALAQREAQSLRALVATMPFPFVAAGALQVQAVCAACLGEEQSADVMYAAAGAEYEAVGAGHRLHRGGMRSPVP